jgi:glutathione S-transferase
MSRDKDIRARLFKRRFRLVGALIPPHICHARKGDEVRPSLLDIRRARFKRHPAMNKLTLIGSPSCPFVQRVVIALNEKHVDFDRLAVDLGAKPDWLLAISPLGQVPVLKIEREGEPPAVIFESAAILDYLEETAPGEKLYPTDPLKRAQHRAWIAFSSNVLDELYRFSTAADGAALSAAHAALRQKLKRLESVRNAGPYFAGQHFSLVDAAFAPAFRQIDALDRVSRTGLLDGFPGLEDWSRALAARESVRLAVPRDHADHYLAQLRAKHAIVIGAAA